MFNRRKFHERWETGESKLKANVWRSNVGVTLYSTRIVDWSEPGSIRLYTGGFLTATTKTVMNEVLSAMSVKARVYQKKGVWYIEVSGKSHEFTEGFRLKRNELKGQIK